MAKARKRAKKRTLSQKPRRVPSIFKQVPPKLIHISDPSDYARNVLELTGCTPQVTTSAKSSSSSVANPSNTNSYSESAKDCVFLPFYDSSSPFLNSATVNFRETKSDSSIACDELVRDAFPMEEIRSSSISSAFASVISDVEFFDKGMTSSVISPAFVTAAAVLTEFLRKETDLTSFATDLEEFFSKKMESSSISVASLASAFLVEFLNKEMQKSSSASAPGAAAIVTEFFRKEIESYSISSASFAAAIIDFFKNEMEAFEIHFSSSPAVTEFFNKAMESPSTSSAFATAVVAVLEFINKQTKCSSVFQPSAINGFVNNNESFSISSPLKAADFVTEFLMKEMKLSSSSSASAAAALATEFFKREMHSFSVSSNSTTLSETSTYHLVAVQGFSNKETESHSICVATGMADTSDEQDDAKLLGEYLQELEDSVPDLTEAEIADNNHDFNA